MLAVLEVTPLYKNYYSFINCLSAIVFLIRYRTTYIRKRFFVNFLHLTGFKNLSGVCSTGVCSRGVCSTGVRVFYRCLGLILFL